MPRCWPSFELGLNRDCRFLIYEQLFQMDYRIDISKHIEQSPWQVLTNLEPALLQETREWQTAAYPQLCLRRHNIFGFYTPRKTRLFYNSVDCNSDGEGDISIFRSKFLGKIEICVEVAAGSISLLDQTG